MDDPVYGPAPHTERWPSLASDGSQFLAVWMNERPGLSEVYATRLGSDGAVLDPTGIRIGRGGVPAVAFNGQNYLIAWLDRQATGDAAVLGVRLLPSGERADPAPLTIASGFRLAGIELASNGEDFLAVRADYSAGQLVATRVLANGSVVGAGAVPLLSDPAEVSSYDVVWNGSDYVVVWEWNDHILARRVATDGTIVDGAPIPVSLSAGAKTSLDVEQVQSDTVVAWAEARREFYTFDIYAARIDGSGSVLDPEGAALIETDRAKQAPQLLSSGGSAILVWQQSESSGASVRSARFDSDLRLAGGPHLLADHSGAPALAANGSRILAVWDNNAVDIVGRSLDLEGRPLDGDPFPLVMAANDQVDPQVAWGAESYLLSWQDRRANGGAYGVRVSETGQVLDDPPIRFSNVDSSRPVLAAIGDQFVAGSREYVPDPIDGVLRPLLRARRLDARGRAIDLEPIEIAPGAGAENLKVAAGKDSYLFHWIDRSVFPSVARYARLGAGGIRLDATPRPLSGGNSVFFAAAAWDGENFIVAWQVSSTLHVNWVGSDGGLVRSEDVEFVLGNNDFLDVEAGTSSHLVVLRDIESSTIDGFFLDHSGRMLHRVAIAERSGAVLRYGATGFDGSDFLVAWRAFGGLSDTIQVARVRERETVVDSLIFPVSAGGSDQRLVLASARATSLLAYSRFDGDPRFEAERVRARIISHPLALGAACERAEACASSYCVDGVCCDARCAGGSADCQACSVASGAPADGHCAVVRAEAGLECRPSAGTCDVAEICDGLSVVCPADLFAPPEQSCSASACVDGTGTPAAFCSGSSAACPAQSQQSPCAPYVCAGNACGTSCAGDGECVPGFVCRAARCVAPSADAGPDAADAGDGSSEIDAADAATFADARVTPTSPPAGAGESDGGCGCKVRPASGAANSGLAPLLLAVLVFAGRARRGRDVTRVSHGGTRPRGLRAHFSRARCA
jgi:hypothetical protein